MKTSFLVFVSVLLIAGCRSVEKPEPEDDWYIPDYHNSVYEAHSEIERDPDLAPLTHQQSLPSHAYVDDGPWSSGPIPQYEAISLLAFIKDQRVTFSPGPVLIAILYICDEVSGDGEGSSVRLFDWTDGFFPMLHEQLSYETKWSIVYTKVTAAKPEFF